MGLSWRPPSQNESQVHSTQCRNFPFCGRFSPSVAVYSIFILPLGNLFAMASQLHLAGSSITLATNKKTLPKTLLLRRNPKQETTKIKRDRCRKTLKFMEINKCLSAVASKFVPSNPFLITTGRPFLPIRANIRNMSFQIFVSNSTPSVESHGILWTSGINKPIEPGKVGESCLIQTWLLKAPDISHSTCWSQTWGPCHWPPLGSKVKMSRFHGTTCANSFANSFPNTGRNSELIWK